MVANRMESSTGGGTEKNETPASSAVRETGEGSGTGGGSGLQTWLPLIITLIAMPLLAYATTTFLILPKLQKSLNVSDETASAEGAESPDADAGAASGGKTGAEPSSGGHGGKATAAKEGAIKGKHTAVFSKVLVNVAGTMGSRYIMTSFTLVAGTESARNRIEENRDLLLDLSSSALGSKTLADLEKPGWRNLLRSELVSVFNDALGKGTVQDIYLTEFAIQ